MVLGFNIQRRLKLNFLIKEFCNFLGAHSGRTDSVVCMDGKLECLKPREKKDDTPQTAWNGINLIKVKPCEWTFNYVSLCYSKWDFKF
jgi:hypothetical protein